ncbi:MAG: hypothetical protein JW384_01747 [Nitrosomonadaceae bacterium]|nr:hypothetical protein [Nitrosomonadaceae bacterium]
MEPTHNVDRGLYVDLKSYVQWHRVAKCTCLIGCRVNDAGGIDYIAAFWIITKFLSRVYSSCLKSLIGAGWGWPEFDSKYLRIETLRERFIRTGDPGAIIVNVDQVLSSTRVRGSRDINDFRSSAVRYSHCGKSGKGLILGAGERLHFINGECFAGSVKGLNACDAIISYGGGAKP